MSVKKSLAHSLRRIAQRLDPAPTVTVGNMNIHVGTDTSDLTRAMSYAAQRAASHFPLS